MSKVTRRAIILEFHRWIRLLALSGFNDIHLNILEVKCFLDCTPSMTHDTTQWFLVSSKAAKTLRILETGTSFKSNVLDMELPRLTRALREFGGVSPRLSREPVELDEAVLLKKREKTRKGSEDDRNSWGKMSEDVVTQCGKHNSVKVCPYIYMYGWCVLFGSMTRGVPYVCVYSRRVNIIIREFN